MPTPAPLRLSDEVAEALATGRPVVALESTLVAHGLPRPGNLTVALDVEATVRAHGAVPATVAVVAGELRVGLDDAALAAVATRDDVAKLGVRDVAVAVAQGRHGATTVASTAVVAARVGIPVFATGGLGGVHRGARESFDESADLLALAAAPLAVVCAGVKSILDVGATLERLETLGVAVLGYGTDRLAGFYVADSGFCLEWRADSPEEVAGVLTARRVLGLDRSALVVAAPLPAAEQLDPALHDRVLADGLERAAAAGITGKAVTPFLLAHLHAATAGVSEDVNARIIMRNAGLAARIARAYAASA